MGGSCSEHDRSGWLPPAQRTSVPICSPRYIDNSYGHPLYKTSERYRANQKKNIHFRRSKDEKHSLTPFKFQLSPHNDRKWESWLKIDEEDLPRGRTSEGSLTITADNDSTSLPESIQERPKVSKIGSNPGLVKQLSPKKRFEATNLPPEILGQLRKLVSKGNPETKAAIEHILLCIKKVPTSQNNKPQRVRNMKSKSWDLNINAKENNVKLTRELVSHYDNRDLSMTSFVSAESEIIAQCDLFDLSETDTGENEPTISGPHDCLGNLKTNILKNDEEMKGSHFDIVEFSKQQVIRSRRKSMVMTEALHNMPSIAQLLESGKDSLQESSINDECVMSQKEIGLETIISKIDELEKKIDKSTQKITQFQRKSFDILTDGDDSGDRDEEGKNLSFLFAEKEIQRWQDHKKKLVNERDELMTKLNNKLLDQINASLGEKKDSTERGNFKANELVYDCMKSDDTLFESFSRTSIRCP